MQPTNKHGRHMQCTRRAAGGPPRQTEDLEQQPSGAFPMLHNLFAAPAQAAPGLGGRSAAQAEGVNGDCNDDTSRNPGGARPRWGPNSKQQQQQQQQQQHQYTVEARKRGNKGSEHRPTD
ncbi:hypothetical protein GGTG_08152 [Gaeumannomyces tritici R3-111a-1]|uniref:Uncharacterized protein n=1 Tax=Gaeumannomyces tritici (strain R3-111a-1) TaxID=644352 RepID=J3P3R7_GAET3|nr:hypothetical protein GGTG_08152 [Gaeumannomyces tritici R3-111a-1]EJT74311.1 hypothetical protein GGTG_08152 [Gaeumannomyces tritici R3-111a-1]